MTTEATRAVGPGSACITQAVESAPLCAGTTEARFRRTSVLRAGVAELHRPAIFWAAAAVFCEFTLPVAAIQAHLFCRRRDEEAAGDIGAHSKMAVARSVNRCSGSVMGQQSLGQLNGVSLGG